MKSSSASMFLVKKVHHQIVAGWGRSSLVLGSLATCHEAGRTPSPLENRFGTKPRRASSLTSSWSSTRQPSSWSSRASHRLWLSNISSDISSLHCGSVSQVAAANYSTSKSAIRPLESGADISHFTPDRIRNFSIIAHIDHGKSTLADRLLEAAGNIEHSGKNHQVLDRLDVEKERGITVKAQSASLIYTYEGKDYLLNLIDTPGHVDFSYEVSRSLAACQGCLLLVDACQGIQAQTVANFYLAFGEGLAILPVINKIDLPTANPEKIAAQLQSSFELDTSQVLLTSAKTGEGIDAIFPAIIENIPCPSGKIDAPPKAFLFDSWFDGFRGVICLVVMIDGTLRPGDKIISSATKQKHEVLEVGVLRPDRVTTTSLSAGQVGYMITGMKNTRDARVGDTFFLVNQIGEPCPGFRPAKATVFSGVYPMDGGDFETLQESIEKLTLNDSSISIQTESSDALGLGFRIGFLGTLHMDVFRQRLESEYDADILITPPTVPYKIIYKNGKEAVISNPNDFPDSDDMSAVEAVQEPIINATIIVPKGNLSPVLTLCESRRGEQKELTALDEERILLRYQLPLSEVIVNFYDQLKSKTAGYASFDYEESGYQTADLVKINVLLNGKAVDALAYIVHRKDSQEKGKALCKKLRELIERQLFEVVIQTSLGGKKIIARETLSALRKDVTAKCYGGDMTRKRKLLDKQKEGKRRMKMVGEVELSQEAFYELMKR